MQNLRHLDHFRPFLGHSEPQIWGSRFWPFFSLQNTVMRGVQSDAIWWLVLTLPFQTQGTHSEAQNGKKSILRPFLTPNPNSGYLIFGHFFSLQNIGMWGVQSDAMWCLVFTQLFQTQGTHSDAQNGQICQIYIFGSRMCQIWSSGVSLKRPCKMQFRHIV